MNFPTKDAVVKEIKSVTQSVQAARSTGALLRAIKDFQKVVKFRDDMADGDIDEAADSLRKACSNALLNFVATLDEKTPIKADPLFEEIEEVSVNTPVSQVLPEAIAKVVEDSLKKDSNSVEIVIERSAEAKAETNPAKVKDTAKDAQFWECKKCKHVHVGFPEKCAKCENISFKLVENPDKEIKAILDQEVNKVIDDNAMTVLSDQIASCDVGECGSDKLVVALPALMSCQPWLWTTPAAPAGIRGSFKATRQELIDYRATGQRITFDVRGGDPRGLYSNPPKYVAPHNVRAPAPTTTTTTQSAPAAAEAPKKRRGLTFSRKRRESHSRGHCQRFGGPYSRASARGKRHSGRAKRGKPNKSPKRR